MSKVLMFLTAMPESYSKSFLRDNAIVIVGVALVYMKGIILMPIIIKTVGVTIYGGFVLQIGRAHV